MGHGASAAGKKGSMVRETEEEQTNTKPVWTRSNSDSCIVESLNSSKTKVDLLEMQISEYRLLLTASELKHKEADDRASTVEKQMAEVEGANFELLDRISDLEQQLESIQAASESEVNLQLEQELTRTSQEVEKLEMHIKLLEEQMASMRSKFRKKLRAANTQVTEVKQESSLKLYSLKDQVKQMEAENLKLSERLERANSGSHSGPKEEQTLGEDSRTMVIVELSNQVSTQEDLIADLRDQLERKEKAIADLTLQLAQERPPSRPVSEASSRPPSGLNNRPLSGRSQHSKNHNKSSSSSSSKERKGSGGSSRSRGERSPDEADIDFQDSESERTNAGSDTVSLGGDCDDKEGKGRNSSARRRRREISGENREQGSDGSRKSSTRERRRSASREKRDSDSTKHLEGGGSSGSIQDTGENGHKRKGSASRSKDKLSPHSITSTLSTEISTNVTNPHTISDFNMNELTSPQGRTCSAGSRDSAFHETTMPTEDGTKSAPSSAGASKTRRRLKAGQQRAASLDTVSDRDKSLPKPPSRTGTNLYDRDSGLDSEICVQGSADRDKVSRTSDQELDDLLHEIMGDANGADSALGSGRNSRTKLGISEDKIRSLLADST